MSKQLIEQLSKLRTEESQIKPDSLWVSKNKKALLSQIKPAEQTVDSRGWLELMADNLAEVKQLFVPKSMQIGLRGVMTVVLIASVAVSGWIATVSASQNSLPGEALYNVKIATEKTELLVTTVIGSDEDEVNTLLKHASTRVDEYNQVKKKSAQQATKAIKSLKKTIESTNKKLTQAQQKPKAGQTAALAKKVEQETEAILESLKEDKEPENLFAPSGRQILPDEELEVEELNKELAETTDLIEETSVKAVEVLIDQEEGGDETVDRDEVKQSVEKKLDKIVTDLEELQQDVENVKTEVNTIIEEGQDEIKTESEESQEELLTVEIEEGTTALVTTTDAVVVEKVKEAGEKVEEANKVAEDVVAEAKTLIENNDLRGALQKVQELTEVKKETVNKVEETKKVTSELTDKEDGMTNVSLSETSEEAEDDVSEEVSEEEITDETVETTAQVIEDTN